jgi:hypothetical protein
MFLPFFGLMAATRPLSPTTIHSFLCQYYKKFLFVTVAATK